MSQDLATATILRCLAFSTRCVFGLLLLRNLGFGVGRSGPLAIRVQHGLGSVHSRPKFGSGRLFGRRFLGCYLWRLLLRDMNISSAVRRCSLGILPNMNISSAFRRCSLVIELETLAPVDVERAASVGTTLLLVLLLGEALAAGHNQVLVSLLAVTVLDVGVG